MKTIFSIACIMALLLSTAWAQKKSSHDIITYAEMPDDWGSAFMAKITVTDSCRRLVRNLTENIRANKPVIIEVASLKAGKYALTVQPNIAAGSAAEFKTDFTKKSSDKRVLLTFRPCTQRPPHAMYAKKPVIYLYPQQVEDVSVSVNFKGDITETIPTYNGGWKVSAAPCGRLTNQADGKQYSYLFWEGRTYKQDWDMKEGFIVRADGSRQFLECQLRQMGLVAREYNEFVEYWLPVLQQNEYNLIHFAGREYEDIAALTIEPKPDAILRVFMVFKSVSKDAHVLPQHFKPFVRKGFTVVEWGGLQLDTPEAGIRLNTAAP